MRGMGGGRENNRTVWHPAYLLTNQAEGSRQVQLHGYPEKMQEGARLRHAGQGNQSSHIVSAVLSFTQRAHMTVTLRNHLWRVLFIAQLYSSITRQQTYKARQQKCGFPQALSRYEHRILCHFSLCNNGISLKCKAVFGVVVVFLKGKKRVRVRDATLPECCLFSHLPVSPKLVPGWGHQSPQTISAAWMDKIPAARARQREKK